MRDSYVSYLQLKKARSRPLNIHCRNLLQKVGVTIYDDTIGTPELILWGLEQEESSFSPQYFSDIKGFVEMLLGRPSMSVQFIEQPSEEESEFPIIKKVLDIEDPHQAAFLLLQHLQERMRYFVLK